MAGYRLSQQAINTIRDMKRRLDARDGETFEFERDVPVTDIFFFQPTSSDPDDLEEDGTILSDLFIGTINDDYEPILRNVGECYAIEVNDVPVES